MGAHQFGVHSGHHQAVDEVGEGLVVVGPAPDQVIEAIEIPDHPWFFAVQWHPELSAATSPEQQRLFESLVEAASGG